MSATYRSPPMVSSMSSKPQVFAKPRCLDPDKLRVAKDEFAKLEAAGIIRRSDSPWSSPLHMARKKDGGWQPCRDYRRLNNITTPDRYPLPNMQDLNSCLAGYKVFSKLDLVKGYHQVPIATADVPKTAIITPFGLFEYLYMQFGLKNASQSFQQLMDCTFQPGCHRHRHRRGTPSGFLPGLSASQGQRPCAELAEV